ncbi:hypothetical protein YC2023_045939 [Brassica napus]
MGFTWGMRLRGASKKKIAPVMSWSESTSEPDITIPPEFQCPISIDLMKDPVIISTGITYDRTSIEKWIDSGNNTCPVTNTVLTTFDQIPNHTIRKMIQGWCVEIGSSLIERIPTPRVPLMPCEVYEICRKLSSATRRGDYEKCEEIIWRIKKLEKESEKNRNCIIENGVALVLCDCFEKFSADAKSTSLLGKILSLLTWMVPIGWEGLTTLASASSFRCIAGFLRSKDDTVRENAAFLLKEILSLEETQVHAFAEENGVAAAFLKLIRDSVSSSATKSSLIAVSQMVLAKPEIASVFLEIGLVNQTVEMIIDGENSVCEKALAVLDAVCETSEGIEEVRKNALVMPLLVKKILKVSEQGTGSSVSAILKLCKAGKASTVEEAVRLGAFQKMFLVLQVGYGEETKEKATELLKMMNTQMKLMSDDVDSSVESCWYGICKTVRAWNAKVAYIGRPADFNYDCNTLGLGTSAVGARLFNITDKDAILSAGSYLLLYAAQAADLDLGLIQQSAKVVYLMGADDANEGHKDSVCFYRLFPHYVRSHSSIPITFTSCVYVHVIFILMMMIVRNPLLRYKFGFISVSV